MKADEFLALPEAPERYALVNGVVVMSPRPTPRHQKLLFQIARQLDEYFGRHALGEAYIDVDVRLSDDVVYAPDICFLTSEKAARVGDRVVDIPDLVVEIVSASGRGFDERTKFADYQAAGIGEYWLIDPERRSFQFFVLRAGRYELAAHEEHRYVATMPPGFVLDLSPIRKLFA